ncbi:MAG: hypothetical protein ABL888_09200 [Pirellulaceae bacterium]
MIFTTLLYFWFAISAVIDPSFAFQVMRPENGGGKRTVLKKHEPVQMPTIEFASQPAPTTVSKNAMLGLGSMTAETLQEISVCQYSVWQNLGACGLDFVNEKIDNVNTIIMEIQAELIIRQLNRLAECHGNPVATIDPYWAHYELFDTRKIVLVDACAATPRSSNGTLQGIRLVYETARLRLQAIAAMSQWLVKKIETFTYLLEHSWSAKNDLRFSCKPDFAKLQKSMSSSFLHGEDQETRPMVRVANRRCNVVD